MFLKHPQSNTAIMVGIVSMLLLMLACSLPFIGEHALYPIRTEDGTHYVDKDGEVVIETEFIQAGEFFEGFAAVMPDLDDFEWGFIDKDGEIVIRPRYQQVWRFSEGYAAVMEDGAWGAIDEDGRMVIEPQFFQPFEFSDGLAAVTLLRDTDEEFGFPRPGESGFIDTDGEFVIGPFEGMVMGNFVDDLAPVNFRNHSGFIDRDEVMVIELDDDIRAGGWFSEGLAPATDIRRQIMLGECSVGFVNKEGDWAIEPQFCEAHPFLEGLARVRTGFDRYEPSYGFIDTSGKLVGDDDYQMAWDFHNGLARVLTDDWEEGYINKDGRWEIRPR